MDDSRELLYLNERILRPQGYTILSAGTLREAGRVLEEVTPDVIVLDIDPAGRQRPCILQGEVQQGGHPGSVPHSPLRCADGEGRDGGRRLCISHKAL